MMSFEKKLSLTLDSFDEVKVGKLLEDIELPPVHKEYKKITKSIIKTNRSHIRPPRKTAAFAVIIISVVLAAITGVAAYVISTHKNSVDNRFGAGAGERLESKALLDGSVFDSEHYIITVDAVLCTGDQIAAVITLEPKDNETISYIRNKPMIALSDKEYERFCDDLTSQGCSVANGGYTSIIDESGETPTIAFHLNIDCRCDEGKLYKTSLSIYDAGLASDYAYSSFGELSYEQQEERKIGTVTLNIQKNLEYKQFESENNVRVGLCDFGLRCETSLELHAFTDELSITFEMKDGSMIKYYGTDISYYSYAASNVSNAKSIANFTRWINTENVHAIIIEGTRYEEMTK